MGDIVAILIFIIEMCLQPADAEAYPARFRDGEVFIYYGGLIGNVLKGRNTRDTNDTEELTPSLVLGAVFIGSTIYVTGTYIISSILPFFLLLFVYLFWPFLL